MKDYSGESFLNHLYQDLHMSDEVMHTANPSDSKDEKLRKYLERLKEAEGLTLPSLIGGYLYLRSLTSAEGLVVTKNFECKKLFSYTYITMQDLINKSLENDVEKGKQRGFSKISILITLSLLASIGIIIL